MAMRTLLKHPLLSLVQERILVYDGAMGTALQKQNLTAADFGGPETEGCNEYLVLSKPQAVEAVHRSYLEAGADIVETNTFGATPLVLGEFGQSDKALDINRAAATLAKNLTKKYSTPDKPRFVAGSMGPTTKSLSVTGGITFDELVEHFSLQARGLLEGGVDILLIETSQDTLNIKAALEGIDRAFAQTSQIVPVSVSATVEPMGTLLAGQNVEALSISLHHRPLFSLGLNCATGPSFMTDHIRTLAQMSPFAVSCLPNAGLPDEDGRYNETPEALARVLERFVDSGWVNFLGGCCGTTPEHIRLISQMVQGKHPRRERAAPRMSFSGLEPLVPTPDMRPLLVGERANVIGSRAFKRLIVEEKFDEASEVARRQARAGAHLIDLCLANPDRPEKADMERLLREVVRRVKAPLMIDSTDAQVIESALKLCQGRSVINSINLEDGEERFQAITPLARRFGAAVVVGLIDENKTQGMAITRERKVAIARRSFDLLTTTYGLTPEDIIFDPLVFPAATGDKNYVGSAQETLEGISELKKLFPRCSTLLGISNVSFGLPEAGREVLNAVFLHHAVKAGLGFAIVNTERLARYASLPEEEKQLADQLLSAGSDTIESAIAAFAAHFRGRVSGPQPVQEVLPPREHLKRAVVQGSKEGLLENLTLLLKEGLTPLELINGPLLQGMDEVGKLFGRNEMIVAEVLQSAEVMKAAVSFLEPLMSQADAASRGTLLLATVKGDVHDIGKNLVHILMKNNGFRVIDLGIKVPPEDLIRAAREHRPDFIGLSGLLVKSAQQMTLTAEDFRAAGIDQPLLVGGAALTEKFTATRIAPAYKAPVFYAKDAMAGLDLAQRLTHPETKEKLCRDNQTRQATLREAPAPPPPATPALRAVIQPAPPMTPPDLKRHILTNTPLEDIFRYINPVMLYGKHFGLRGRLDNLINQGDEKAVKLHAQVEALKTEVLAQGWITPRGVWQFFPAQSDGNRLFIYNPQGTETREMFDFPRQLSGEGLCLSDFVSSRQSGVMDYVGFFAVTAGEGIPERARIDQERGDYWRSHALQSLALESAEALAEWLHEKLRAMWGFPDDPATTLSDKFQARYRGLRVSFGYPACPRLEDQEKLFRLISPQETGIQLTEGFMMHPEASVSALVLHHPQARYFSVEESSR